MMIRAFIREDLPGMFLEIALIQVSDDMPRRILRIDEAGANTTYRWEDLPDRPTNVAPTLQLGDSEARALLEALGRHYSGGSDVRALRADLDYERKRVDELIALMGAVIANGIQRPPRRPPDPLIRKLAGE
ncbi:hypothetical protein [Actinomadura rubrisoli]|uniref:Uncharacterized protein n=1 Tax=Actinomadura rubrisoli TaxID=2530368 RepID=A0A4V2YZP5_9ACTN|nr:hypothetical protein [Actinomadura rubrisoli]TDD97627.1 hypothetical protein E1298_00930 [Actinomadura rubrisoli]